MLLNLADEAPCDLFLRPWNDEVKKLFVAYHCLVVVRHQVNQEGALLLTDGALERAWLQIAREENIE